MPAVDRIAAIGLQAVVPCSLPGCFNREKAVGRVVVFVVDIRLPKPLKMLCIPKVRVNAPG